LSNETHTFANKNVISKMRVEKGRFLAWHESTQLCVPHWRCIDLYERSIFFTKPQIRVGFF